MSIIASSIKQQQLTMEFFSDFYTDSLGKRSVFRDITKMLLNTIHNNTIISSYKSCAQMLKANNISVKDSNYTEAFTALKKLGIILKHDNSYLLNPAVKANYTSRRYQLIVEYYNLLFKDTSFVLSTLDDLKLLAVSSYMSDIEARNQLIEENNFLYEKSGSPRYEYKQPINSRPYDNIYTLAFETAKPKSLSSFDKPIYKAVNEAYRNVCGNYITRLLINHITMLEQQGLVIVEWGGPGTKTKYNFNRLTLKLQKTLISFDQTEYYLDNLPTPDEELALQLFADTQQDLQQQFEEEDLPQHQEPINTPMILSISNPYNLSTESRYNPVVDNDGIEIPTARSEYDISQALCGRGLKQLPKVRKLFCTLPQYRIIPTRDKHLLSEEGKVQLEEDLATYGHNSKTPDAPLYPYHSCTPERKAEIQQQDALVANTASNYNDELRACNERNRIKQSQMFQDYLVARKQYGFTSIDEYKEAINYQPEIIPIPSPLS